MICKCIICKKETSNVYGGEMTPACNGCYESGELQAYLDGKILPKEGAPFGNRNAAKPAERHRQNATFKLSPEIIARLKSYSGNKSRLVETLLTQYFERSINND